MFNPQPKPKKRAKKPIRPLKRIPLKKTTKKIASKSKKNTDNQLELFKRIWSTRKHTSFISGLPIESFDHKCFHHVLPKGKYPKFKMNEDNIIIITPHEHHIIHFGSEEHKETYGCWFGWKNLEVLTLKLKQEYEKDKKGL